ncbi:MAG: asparaginase domain-containing protein, partial [Oscillospiraceae bacterium]|nr:asparaginase domain-containing protein [Oscillospiraceae bacterium]
MNDIFLLYKCTNTEKNRIEKIRNNLINADKLRNFIIKDYDDSLPEESFYESTRSSILVCLIDDEWFYDEQYRNIWKYFWNKQKEPKYKCQILFPVLIKKIINSNFDGIKKTIFSEAERILGFYNGLNDNSPDIEDLYSDVKNSLEHIEKDNDINFHSKHSDETITNVHSVYSFLCSSIDKSETENAKCWDEKIKKCDKIVDIEERRENINSVISELEKVLKENAINDNVRKYPDAKRVCVLYTGGTAGMIFENDPDVKDSLKLIQADSKQLIIKLPRLKKEKFEIDFYSFDKALDSSNIGSQHWMLMAAVIEILSEKYNGFVIIHGTNTMAYTASAISFLFDNTADKPIVLTGSELALTEGNSDAEQNILRAIEIAAQKDTTDITGVCILFGKWILRGNRTTKQIALDKTEGFYSPNFPAIASISSDKVIVDLAHSTNVKPSQNSFSMNRCISSHPKVAICDIYPDMDMEAFKNTCNSNSVEAVILRTYGTGGVPDRDSDFIDCLKGLKDRKIVVNLTQCPKGTSEFRLFETNETLFNYGVISGGDMVTEAAYCKLKHLFSKFSPIQDTVERMKCIRHYMMVNIQGEMSKSMFVVPVPIRNDCVEIKEDGGRFELDENWSENPALDFRRVLKKNLDQDSFAKLDHDKDFIESAVLRLGRVSILDSTQKNKDIHLKLEISIFPKNGYEKENDNKTITHSVKFAKSDRKDKDINIDCLEIAKNYLKPAKNV